MQRRHPVGCFAVSCLQAFNLCKVQAICEMGRSCRSLRSDSLGNLERRRLAKIRRLDTPDGTRAGRRYTGAGLRELPLFASAGAVISLGTFTKPIVERCAESRSDWPLTGSTIRCGSIPAAFSGSTRGKESAAVARVGRTTKAANRQRIPLQVDFIIAPPAADLCQHRIGIKGLEARRRALRDASVRTAGTAELHAPSTQDRLGTTAKFKKRVATSKSSLNSLVWPLYRRWPSDPLPRNLPEFVNFRGVFIPFQAFQLRFHSLHPQAAVAGR